MTNKKLAKYLLKQWNEKNEQYIKALKWCNEIGITDFVNMSKEQQLSFEFRSADRHHHERNLIEEMIKELGFVLLDRFTTPIIEEVKK